MDSHIGHVLLIENDTELSHLIADQALIPLGYQVEVFETASDVVQDIVTLAPDVIITDLNLPGLSGKDLMVALASMGSTVPIIVIGKKDQVSDLLQAIRLGAADFLTYPVRETEVVSAIEKTLYKSQLESKMDLTTKKLEKTEALLQQQQTDFSELFSFCKLALFAKGPQSLVDRLPSLTMQLTQADCAWLSILTKDQSKFRLQACQNLPDGMPSNFELPYDDELSALAAASGQAISIHGEILSRFKVYEPFGAALIVPILHDDHETSIITAVRNAAQPFTQYQLGVLELMAEIASASMQYEKRHRQIEHLMVMLQQSNIFATIESTLKYELLRQASLEIRAPLKYLLENVDFLLDKGEKTLDPEQTSIGNQILEQAEILMDIADSMINYRQAENLRLESIDLNEIVRTATNRFRPIAQMGKIDLKLDLPPNPSFIKVYSSQITRVFEGLLSNALKFSPANGEVTIRIEQQETDILLSVIDQGNGIDQQMADGIFDIKSSVFGYTPKRFGGIGISLPRIKEIISAYKGRTWIEPSQGSGFKITVSFPVQPVGVQ